MQKTMAFLLCLFSLAGRAQTKQEGIHGQLLLGEKWQPMAYLSYIPNMNERFTVSSQMIIDEAPLNDSGYFVFNSAFLPEEEGLYRIHVSKKGYPRATLTIGGDEQNFQFLLARKNSSIGMFNTDTAAPFQSVAFRDSLNQQIIWVNNWANFVDSAHFAGTSLKKELIAEAIHEKLRRFADTCNNPLLALYALYNSDFENSIPTNAEFFNAFLDKWKSEDSDYYLTFASAFQKEEPRKSYTYLWVGFTCFALGGLSVFLWTRTVSSKNREQKLSVQERKVLQLLKEGKSNKEISEEYNIGVNTVKSHVSSIYAKLKVKSRKELHNPNA